MRFVVDECIGPTVAHWLAAMGHDVLSIYDTARGAEDEEVLRRAAAERRILITADKDFGQKVFREGLKHSGVVLLRLANETPASKMAAITRLLSTHSERLADNFIVVTENAFRIAGKK